MTAQSIAFAAYIVAALLFILSLAGLSRHETSKQGIVYGIAGMTIALVATIGQVANHAAGISIALLFIAIAIGAVIGLWRAKIVEMTGMPELIALLHSFVGLAAVLVGWSSYFAVEHHSGQTEFAGSETIRASAMLSVSGPDASITNGDRIRLITTPFC